MVSEPFTTFLPHADLCSSFTSSAVIFFFVSLSKNHLKANVVRIKSNPASNRASTQSEDAQLTSRRLLHLRKLLSKLAYQTSLYNQKNIEFKAMSCQYKDLQHCFKPSECAESWKSMSPSTPLGKALKVAGQGLQHANCSCPIFMICPIMYVPTLCKFMGAKSQADVY